MAKNVTAVMKLALEIENQAIRNGTSPLLTAANEIERLRKVLFKIATCAESPRDDDHIWIDERTTLEGFIDSEINNYPR